MDGITIKEFPLEEEYKKKTGISPQDIAGLRDWLHTQPHLPSDYITDLDIILTYHCCDRSSEVSKQLLDLHFTLRTLFTRFFQNRVFDERTKNTLMTVLMKPLPTRSSEGYACMYYRVFDENPKKFVYVDAVRASLMVLDVCQRAEGTWPGLLLLLDMEGSTLSLRSGFTDDATEALLLKLKGLHILNAPPFVDKLMQLIKPFVKRELMDIMKIHLPGSRTLDKFYPMDALPKEAGGKYKTFAECRDDTIELMKANTEYFVEENKKRVVGSLRPGKPKTIEDIFGGVLGSFKKLDID